MPDKYMLTLVGGDQPGIVARVTGALFEAGCNLGEASMMRLGDSFSMMLVVESDKNAEQLCACLEHVRSTLKLTLHIDPAQGDRQSHAAPDVCITVYGADRSGIVAQVTGAAANAGLDIVDLVSDIGGTDQEPLYILHIEGIASKGVDALNKALVPLQDKGIRVDVSTVDTLIG